MISVIVPVYNVENYLNKCIESICNQTYKNIEIILVDDGSTDKSGVICDEYKKKDKRIRVFHKANGGLSDARNYGIDVSLGEYLVFIDSDDYIETEMLEKLYKAMIENNADIASCGKFLDYNNKTIIKNSKTEFLLSGYEALGRMLLYDEIDTSACDKIFKKKLFEKVRFPVGKYYEDMGTMYKLLASSEKVAHIRYTGYHYVFRNNSIVNSKFSLKQLDILYFSKEILDFVKIEYPTIIEQAESNYILNLMTTLMNGSNVDEKEIKSKIAVYRSEFNKIFFKSLSNKYIPLYKKIMLFFIRMRLYSIVKLIKNLYKR